VYTIEQRDSPESGLRLWRIVDGDGVIVGYAADLGEIIEAIEADGEDRIRLRVPSGWAVLEIKSWSDYSPGSVQDPANVAVRPRIDGTRR